MSGDERQAFSLLLATFTEPQIPLLDEHTAALATVTPLVGKNGTQVGPGEGEGQWWCFPLTN